MSKAILAMAFAGHIEDWPDGLGDEDCVLYLESIMGEFALAMYTAEKEYDVRGRRWTVTFRDISPSFFDEVCANADKLTYEGVFILVPKGPFAPKPAKL